MSAPREPEYCAAIATPETFAEQLAFVMRVIEEHGCADASSVKWRCDLMPGKVFTFQIWATWPCGGNQ